jgi:hypothetical protein
LEAGLGTTAVKTKLLLLSVIEHRLPNPNLSRYFRPLILYQTALRVALHVLRIREVPRQNIVPDSGHTTQVTLYTKLNTNTGIKALNSKVYAIHP